MILIVYMCARGLHKQTWGGWSWESLSEWGQYVKFGVPGLLMVCCEWWSFEITAIVAGSIDETQLGINSIIMNLTSMIFTVSLCLPKVPSVVFILSFSYLYSYHMDWELEQVSVWVTRWEQETP